MSYRNTNGPKKNTDGNSFFVAVKKRRIDQTHGEKMLVGVERTHAIIESPKNNQIAFADFFTRNFIADPAIFAPKTNNNESKLF